MEALKGTCAWVAGRARTAAMVGASLAARPPHRNAAGGLAGLSPYNLAQVLAFVGPSPGAGVRCAARLFRCDRHLAHLGLTARHVAWRALAVAGWSKVAVRAGRDGPGVDDLERVWREG